MKIIVTAGGSGGHIYPALSVINKFREHEKDLDILYIGTTDRMEKDIIPNENINYVGIKMQGINRKNIFKNFKTLYLFLLSKIKIRKTIKNFDPDIVIGFGGYVTGPVIRVAKSLGYKTFIHEQNVVPGVTNKYLEKYSDIIATTFKESNKYFKKDVILTGHPRVEEALNSDALTKSDLGFDNKRLILVVMGSLGSKTINEKLLDMIPKFKNKNYNLLIITGKAHYYLFKELDTPSNVKVLEYHNELLKVYKAVDLVVSRASAATILETYANNIPNILVPSPYVADNHQYKNAKSLENEGSAILLEEKDFDYKNLSNIVEDLFNNEDKYNSLVNNINKENIRNSATYIYELLKKEVEDGKDYTINKK